MQDWVPQFSAQFGDLVSTDVAAFVIQGVTPACVCSPENEEQVAAVIRFAAAHRIAVVPCGGLTQQGRCSSPPPGFLALSTQCLNKLIHHEPGDMVATVQGGTRFLVFQNELRTRGQWLPIDTHVYSTVGGLVAANTHGPRALGYGTLRDMILGMTVINGDGVIRKCGGKVVKNVTGYSLDKLYIGSMGGLGIVTEVTFKLRPLSADARCWSTRVSTRDEGLDAIQKIASKNLPLELLGLHNTEGQIWYLQANAAGTETELARVELELKSAAPNLNFTHMEFNPHFEVTPEVRSSAALHKSFGSSRFEMQLAERASKRTASGALVRFGCVPSKLRAAVQILNNYETAPQSISGGSGVFDISPLTSAEALRISAELEKLGVNFAWENIVGVNIPNRWGSPRPEWAIMKQIKAALDPQGIMNPGRFVV